MTTLREANYWKNQRPTALKRVEGFINRCCGNKLVPAKIYVAEDIFLELRKTVERVLKRPVDPSLTVLVVTVGDRTCEVELRQVLPPTSITLKEPVRDKPA